MSLELESGETSSSGLSKGSKKSHVCPVNGCQSSFSRPYRLKLHLLVHENVKAFSCSKEGCNKSYSNKSHLKRHIKNVHNKDEIENDILYSCPTCFTKFANRQNLKRHIKLVHTMKPTYNCDICKKCFKKKHQLSSHLYQHTGVKAFSCDHCPADFISLTDKKSHMRCHKTYTCENCRSIFNQWSKYQKHLKTEHDPKEYICNDCDRKFKQRVHIVRHLRQGLCTNMEPRSFSCPFKQCERNYKRNSNLRQHIFIYHENYRFQCDICGATLCTKAKLENHVKTIHGEKRIKKISKTRETGRQYRKDFGTIKVHTALKLSGINDIVSSNIINVENNVELVK